VSSLADLGRSPWLEVSFIVPVPVPPYRGENRGTLEVPIVPELLGTLGNFGTKSR